MRPFFICLSIALGFSINPLVMAQNANAGMQNLIQSMQLKKADIENMINMLVSSGQISKADGEAAKSRLSELNEKDVQSLTMEAISNLHGQGTLNADGVKKEDNSRKPASLPVSPFSGINVKDSESEIERKRVEEVQKNLLKNAFDIKKFQ